MIGTLLLNRYELLENIGEGGMGTVYKAKCHLLNRFVAVKILKTELSTDEEFVERFKREATSIAKLSHPNIVNVHDVGTENNINFIVMEYINGKTLKQVIKGNGRLTSERTLDIVLQITEALECAHKNNIIHRDIKPDNIMITEDNIVKVMDFGIAKVTDTRTVTNSNKIMGSVYYFSPEQAKGNFVDCRTDIYSIGIVMYEMMTGRVPYNAENSITIAMMHIQGSVTAPKEIITDMPRNINQVILRAMEKEPIKRYQTAKEMAVILRAIKQDSNYKEVNNGSDGATKIRDAANVFNIKDDSTTVMSKAASDEQTINKKDREILLGNKRPSKNKKAMIIIVSIILVMIAGVLGRFSSKGTSTNAPSLIKKLPVIEKKFVPSLIGRTQDTAKQTAVNNGFLLGNVTNNYSDSTAKGLVISQLPKVNTSYEKGGKIDLVISQGKKTVQITVVPSLIGRTQYIANQTVINNGFLLGNVTNNYSDSTAKGLVISQLPKVNTPYERGGKIDLVISQGKKIAQVTVPKLKVENHKNKGNHSKHKH